MNQVTMAAGSDGEDVQVAVRMSPSLYDSSKPSILGRSFGRAEGRKAQLPPNYRGLYYTPRLNIIKRKA